MPPSFLSREHPSRVAVMTISPLLCTLAAAASLLLSAPAWSAGEPPPPPAASQSAVAAVAETRTLIEQGRFEEALSILRPLAQDRAVEANVLFLIGLAATGASQQPGLSGDEREALLDEAIASLRVMLIDRPDLVRVRLELARAFFLKGENDLSRKHFEHVLAGSPPGAVAAKVRRFLSEIRARRRWSLRAGFALAPDTNIGGTSAERIIYINDLPFSRDQAELTTSGIGVSVWGGWEYQYPLNERLRLRIGADASRREYAGRRFDQMFVSGHAGPRWLVGVNTEASVLASAHRRWSANVPDYDALGGRIEAGHRFTRRVTASARASWYDRRYRTRMFLDGPVMAASLSGAWVVTPTVRADIALGWGREQPERERWRNDSQWLRLGASVILPRGFTVGGSGELRLTEYEGNWFPFTTSGEPREDRTRSLRVSVHNRAFTWKGFSPQLSLVHEVRTTNAQLYDYKRTGGELRFVRLF